MLAVAECIKKNGINGMYKKNGKLKDFAKQGTFLMTNVRISQEVLPLRS